MGVLATALGQVQQPYCGTVVFTGGADAAARTVGLGEEGCGEVGAGGRTAAEPFLAA